MKTLTIIGIILAPLVLLLGAFSMLVYNVDFQADLLDKYSQHPELGKKINIQLLEYFKSKSENPAPIKEFTPEENQHMLDVKVRLNQVTTLWLIILAIFLAVRYASSGDEKCKMFLYGGPLTIAPFLIYGLVPFDALFERMHMGLFAPGTWVFPADSLMVQVYTNEFFFWFTFAFATIALILGLGTAVLAWMARN